MNYVTTEELKLFIGIANSAQDSKLAMLNKMATDVVNGILEAKDLSLHKVIDEAHYPATIIELRDANVRAIDKIMDGDTEYTQEEPYDILSNRLRLSGPADFTSSVMASRSMKISYLAGYYASGWAKITISDQANIAPNAIVTIGVMGEGSSTTITRGDNWIAGEDERSEAVNLAVAINDVEGVKAFSVGTDVYVIENTNPQVTGRAITVSDNTRLILSSSELGGVDFPESIRLAVMLYVSNLMQVSKNPRMKSYSIGSKSVTFSSEAEFNQFSEYLKPYRRARLTAI